MARTPIKYPELEMIARRLADDCSAAINRNTAGVVSEMPYRAQYTLERIIRILESRV
jgi:hypothetical protein